MRILITGASGLIGSRLARYLSGHGDDVVLGSRKEGDAYAFDGLATVQMDWSSDASLRRACAGVDAVIHAAGMNAQGCTADPVAALLTNGVGSARLARAARVAGVQRFVYFSTAHVYASPLVGVVTEETCPRNPHPYASSHLAGELAVLHESRGGPMQGLVLRLSNAFGAPVLPLADCWMLLANDLCRQLARNGRMQLASDGMQWRDFIPVTSVCEVIRLLLANSRDFNAVGVLNLGARSMRVLDMAQLIQARGEMRFGVRAPLDRPDVREPVPPALDYPSGRLAALVGPLAHDFDTEIDALLAFCIQHFSLGGVAL